MTPPTPNLAAVEDRLERLERQLRVEKHRTRSLLVAVALAALAVVLAWSLASTPATDQTQGPKVVRANQFVLDDEKGRPRVWLFVDKNGPRMTMLDENKPICTQL